MADERVERKPAAILAADVAGYSRLMGERHATLHPTMAKPFFDGLRKAGLAE